jgi:YNFM family putative membrane transporter
MPHAVELAAAHPVRTQVLVFLVVWAAFAMIYITQPVLPVLQAEFGVSASAASRTVSAVILGIALANLPFGVLADRLALRSILMVGGAVVSLAGLACAATHNLTLLVFARFLQGLCLPALTTCVAAFVASVFPPERLNVAMGTYVSATVAGGLTGRLLGGLIHPPLHWRWAFVTASALLAVATLSAALGLPRVGASSGPAPLERGTFRALLARPEVRRIYLAAFGAFFVFSACFNYLPFYLAGPPFHAPVTLITLMYLTYIVGIFMGPVAGALCNRLGSGLPLMAGALVLALALAVSLIPRTAAVLTALMGVCLGFFTLHAAAAGALNRRLQTGRGRANSLYVLFYYLGGAAGISLSGHAYALAGWPAVVGLGIVVLMLPLAAGWREWRPRPAASSRRTP